MSFVIAADLSQACQNRRMCLSPVPTFSLSPALGGTHGLSLPQAPCWLLPSLYATSEILLLPHWLSSLTCPLTLFSFPPQLSLHTLWTLATVHMRKAVWIFSSPSSWGCCSTSLAFTRFSQTTPLHMQHLQQTAPSRDTWNRARGSCQLEQSHQDLE